MPRGRDTINYQMPGPWDSSCFKCPGFSRGDARGWNWLTHNTQFLLNTVIGIKKEAFFSFCIVYLSFYEVGNLSKLFNFCSAGIINTFFQIQDGGQLLCTVSKFKAFSSRCAFENVGNGTKTDLLSNTNTVECKDLSKIITLSFKS